jgi:ribose 5-phosphate isomerase B
MKIAIASDHRGFQAKERLKAILMEMGHEIVDFGTESDRSCDYTDFAAPASYSVVRKETDLGILLCGTGIGMSLTANKIHGVRAALCQCELTAELSRRHNDANVLCLPADLLSDELIRRMVEVWLNTPFEGGRHSRRLRKVSELESDGRQPAEPCPPPEKGEPTAE